VILVAFRQLGSLSSILSLNGLSHFDAIMDAAEADLDAKLYKASGDIISELQVKLPLLIWHERSRQRLRTHVLYSKCEELNTLVSLIAQEISELVAY
jgi:hypothetical protein